MLVIEVTEWFAPIMVTPKRNKGYGSHKNVCGFTQAKPLCKNRKISMLTPFEAITDIAAKEARHFIVLDAMKLYHQYPLDVESHTLTTFITPFSHFKYLRAPYSMSFMADHSNCCIVEVQYLRCY